MVPVRATDTPAGSVASASGTSGRGMGRAAWVAAESEARSSGGRRRPRVGQVGPDRRLEVEARLVERRGRQGRQRRPPGLGEGQGRGVGLGGGRASAARASSLARPGLAGRRVARSRRRSACSAPPPRAPASRPGPGRGAGSCGIGAGRGRSVRHSASIGLGGRRTPTWPPCVTTRQLSVSSVPSGRTTWIP